MFFFSLTIFSIQSTHSLLSVDDDFQKYYLTFWRREAQLFLKCDWWKPVKLCIIPILLLHDCCGMLQKSCVINLKVTHSPEILSWSVFLHERANMWTTSNHFRTVLFLLKLAISSMIYRGYLTAFIDLPVCVSVPTTSWKSDWFTLNFEGKLIVLVIFWQLK